MRNKKIRTIVGHQVNNQIHNQVEKASVKYSKPAKYDRNLFEDADSMKKAKRNTFNNNEKVYDPYTGAELRSKKLDAKMDFGVGEYNKHLAHADHAVPEKRVFEDNKNKPFITNDNIKKQANCDENFVIVSGNTNQSKGQKTNKEFVRDTDTKSNGAALTPEGRLRAIEDEKNAAKTIKKIQRKQIRENVLETGIKAGTSTATSAAGTAATIAAIYNIDECIRGNITVEEALKNVTGSTIKSAGVGAIEGSSLTILNHTLSYADSDFVKALGKNNVAGKAITAVSVVGDTVTSWGRGDINTYECLEQLGDDVATYAGNAGGSAVGSFVGGSLGTAICPVVGTAIGETVGGAVCSIVGGELTSGIYNGLVNQIKNCIEEESKQQQLLYEAMMKKLAEENRRLQVMREIDARTEYAVVASVKMIMTSPEFFDALAEAGNYLANHFEAQERVAQLILVTLQLQNYCTKLNHIVNSYLQSYSNCLNDVINSMESCLCDSNYASAIASVNQITRLMGEKPVVEDVKDFKEKMFSKQKIEI